MWFKRYRMKDFQFFIEGRETGRREVIGIRANLQSESEMDALCIFQRMFAEEGKVLGYRED